MHSKEESLKAGENVEELEPASRFLLENRAVEERETKTLKEQIELSAKTQKKALEEIKMISESMKSTDDRMVSHLEKMVDANIVLKAHYEWINSMESVEVRFGGETEYARKIPVAVVQFSKRRIVKGSQEYGRCEVERSNEVIAVFDPRDVENSIDCKTSEITDEKENTSFSFTQSPGARCSSCEFARMEKFFDKQTCSRCGNVSKECSESVYTSTSSVFSSDEDSLHNVSSSSSASSSSDRSSSTPNSEYDASSEAT